MVTLESALIRTSLEAFACLMLLLKTFHFLNSFSIHENVKYFNIISPSARLDGNKLNHVSKSLSFSSGKSKTGKSVTSNLLKILIKKIYCKLVSLAVVPVSIHISLKHEFARNSEHFECCFEPFGKSLCAKNRQRNVDVKLHKSIHRRNRGELKLLSLKVEVKRQPFNHLSLGMRAVRCQTLMKRKRRLIRASSV